MCKKEYDENLKVLRELPRISKRPQFYSEEDEMEERHKELLYSQQEDILKSLNLNRINFRDELERLEGVKDLEVFRVPDDERLVNSVEKCPCCSTNLSYDGKLVEKDGVVTEGAIKHQVAKYHQTSDLNVAELYMRKEQLKSIDLMVKPNLKGIQIARKEYEIWEKRDMLLKRQTELEKEYHSR